MWPLSLLPWILWVTLHTLSPGRTLWTKLAGKNPTLSPLLPWNTHTAHIRVEHCQWVNYCNTLMFKTMFYPNSLAVHSDACYDWVDRDISCIQTCKFWYSPDILLMEPFVWTHKFSWKKYYPWGSILCMNFYYYYLQLAEHYGVPAFPDPSLPSMLIKQQKRSLSPLNSHLRRLSSLLFIHLSQTHVPVFHRCFWCCWCNEYMIHRCINI